MTVGPNYTHQRGPSTPHHKRSFRLGLNKWKVGAPNAHKVFGGGSFPCVYRNAKGTLYTTSDGISFVGKNFLFQKTVHIQWSDILEIVEHDKKIGSSSSISLVTNGDTKSSNHVFSKVKRPQQTLKTLLSMHNESMHVRSDISTTSSDDTSIISHDSEDEDAELQDEWKQLKHDVSYSNHAIQDQEMPCTIDTFFDKFIADSASHSTKLYQEANGDTDISVSRWKFDKTIDAYVRTIEFKHPVDIAVAPPFARARKEQRYRRFGQYGLSIETDTYVQDVPLATCFYTADRVLVEPSVKKEGHVVVHAKFDVRFIKRMMFQSLAASLTAKKFVEGFQNLEQYWSTSLTEGSSSSVSLSEEMPNASGPPSRTVSRASTAAALDTETRNVQATSMVSQSVPNTWTVTPILCTRMQFMVLACGLASFLLANACLSQSC